MNVSNDALFQNCINGSAAPNRRTDRAPDKKSFKWHLLNRWPKFKIISQNCASWCTLPKFHKRFHCTVQSFSDERPRAQGSSCFKCWAWYNNNNNKKNDNNINNNNNNNNRVCLSTQPWLGSMQLMNVLTEWLHQFVYFDCLGIYL